MNKKRYEKRGQVIKALIILIAIFVLFFALSSIAVCIKICDKLPYEQPTIAEINYNIVRPVGTDYETLKTDVDALFNNPDYNLIYFEFGDKNIYGKTNFLEKEILIKKGINYEYFVFCLTHELVHLTYFSYDERFCNLTAYNILYSSNNTYFQNIALLFANMDLQGAFNKEYSFVGYL